MNSHQLNKTLQTIKNYVDSGFQTKGNDYWRGKNALIIGDSYSDPSNSHPKWYAYLESMLGLNISRNYSVGGYRICPKRFDEDAENGKDDKYNHYIFHNTYDYTNIQVIIICTGINDFFNSVPIGEVKGAEITVYTPEDDKPDPNTFIGAYEIILMDIMTRACTADQPLPLVVLCTPTNSHTIGAYKNSNNLCTEDYANAIHKIAQAWGCAVCDWNKGSGWNAQTTYANTKGIKAFASDGCHPNEIGAERLGRMVVNTIRLF